MSAHVRVERAGVKFVLDRQKRPVTPAMARIRRRCTSHWGLRDLSLEIRPGESVALMGGNGVGKTTLLRLLAGVLAPDEGTVDVRGRVGSLLSVEAGLIPRLTGRENALLLGVLTGLSRAAARDAMSRIRDSSGLGDAFERPVNTYSQGMAARLGLAVVECADPDVLLLDEVFEAIDAEFREILAGRVRRLTARGGIVVAAGHDHAALAAFCEQALVLDREGVASLAPIAEVAAPGLPVG